MPLFPDTAALMKRILLLSLGIASLVSSARAGDGWRQFRGPNGTGLSETKGLPVDFGPEKNVLWKTPLPGGHSSPVLGRKRIFLTAMEASKLLVIALDLRSGKLAWQREVPRARTDRFLKPNNAASPSPVTDGENVYAFFQDFGLISFDNNGRERWRVPLGPFNVLFGFGASPILVHDLVVLPCDQDTNSFLIAVEQKTGRVRWRTERPDIISGYSTPILYQPRAGETQVLVPESFQLSAYSSKTGKRVWWVRGLAPEMKSIPSHDRDSLYINGWGVPQGQPGKQVKVMPFAEAVKKYDKDDDGQINLEEGKASGEAALQGFFFEFTDLDKNGRIIEREWQTYRDLMNSENGLLAIRMGGQGDMTQRAVRWSYRKPVPQVPSTLLYRGVLYMVNDSGILISFDPATGNVWKQGRLAGAIDKYFASPVGADGKVYLASQDGTVSVVKAAAEWEVLAVNPLGDEVFATPAIAQGRIYIRTRSALYCFAAAQGNQERDE